MIKKFRCTTHSEIMALMAVLSIVVLAEPRSLLSQSVENVLARGEMAVAEFYLQRGNLAGALIRFEYIIENYENFDDMDIVLYRIGEIYERADAQNTDVAVAGWHLKEDGGNHLGRVIFPVQIHKVEPLYPETAKSSGISGDIMLHVSLDEKGEVTSVSAINGYLEFREAAVSAVSQWRYEPALSSGKPVPTVFGVLIRFLPDGTVYSEQGWSIYSPEYQP